MLPPVVFMVYGLANISICCPMPSQDTPVGAVNFIPRRRTDIKENKIFLMCLRKFRVEQLQSHTVKSGNFVSPLYPWTKTQI
jgi:hypothetical protein